MTQTRTVPDSDRVQTEQDRRAAVEALRLVQVAPRRAAERAVVIAGRAQGRRNHATAAIALRVAGLAALYAAHLGTATDRLRAAVQEARAARSPQLAGEARMSLAAGFMLRGQAAQALSSMEVALLDLTGLEHARGPRRCPGAAGERRRCGGEPGASRMHLRPAVAIRTRCRLSAEHNPASGTDGPRSGSGRSARGLMLYLSSLCHPVAAPRATSACSCSARPLAARVAIAGSLSAAAVKIPDVSRGAGALDRGTDQEGVCRCVSRTLGPAKRGDAESRERWFGRSPRYFPGSRQGPGTTMTGAFASVIVVCGVRFRPDVRGFPTGWTTPASAARRCTPPRTPH
jgi:hypothetical protein